MKILRTERLPSRMKTISANRFSIRIGKIVKGYTPAMPTYANSLRDAQLEAIVAYVKSLGTEKGEQMSSHEHGASYLTAEKGFKSWITSVDHKRIGLMYLVMVSMFFLIAGLLALAVRTELLTPAGDLFDGDTYNKVFTLHGALMVFVFIIPSIPATLGNFFLPIMVGAKDVAFPRLNLGSFYIYLFGAFFLVTALLAGGLDTGWTFYTPYSSKPLRWEAESF